MWYYYCEATMNKKTIKNPKGAGRTKGTISLNPAKNRTIRLTDADYKKFLDKGGVKWLRSIL